MTPHREDYIKAIYSANIKEEKISNKILADALQISPPSVSEMIKKLIEANVIRKDKNLGYILNESGILEAQRLMNKHRLWEVFLVEYLGYDWDEVHDDAEVLEHATSDTLLDKLNHFLNYPQFCPHGSEIFGNGVYHQKTIVLADVLPGKKIVVRNVLDDGQLLKYLFNRKVMMDKKYTVVSIDSFDQSMLLLDENNQEIILGKRALKDIYVEVIDYERNH